MNIVGLLRPDPSIFLVSKLITTLGSPTLVSTSQELHSMLSLADKAYLQHTRTGYVYSSRIMTRGSDPDLVYVKSYTEQAKPLQPERYSYPVTGHELQHVNYNMQHYLAKYVIQYNNYITKQ